MRLTQKPLYQPPYTCAATGREDGQMVDFQCDVVCQGPPHLYLKREVVEEAGELCGMVKVAEVEELRSQVARLESELEELRPNADLVAQLDDLLNTKGARDAQHARV